MKITARNSALLVKQLDRFNEGRDDKSKCYCNWGREGDFGTWFVHNIYGSDLKTGRSFIDVIDYIQEDINNINKFATT